MLNIKLDHGWAGQLDRYWRHTWSWLTPVLSMLDINVVRGWCTMLDQGLTSHHGWSSLISSMIVVDEAWYQAWSRLMKCKPWWSMMRQPWSSIMKYQAWYIKVDVSSIIYQAWTRVDEPSTFIKREAWSKLIAHQPLIKIATKHEQGLMSHQPWLSMWDF